MKKLHQLAFFVPPRDNDHTLFWHQLRDGAAFVYLREAILKAGIKSKFAGVIRNVPNAPPPDSFKTDALIVATTRFPLDDEEEDRRTVVPGCNVMEDGFLFPVARKFFMRLSRQFAVLANNARPHLKADYHNRYYIQFSSERGARCTHYVRQRQSPQRTAAYFINVPMACPGGPGLVWSFGLSGEPGLIWNKILCEEYTRMLKQPHFAIAEFDVPHRTIPNDVAGHDDRYGPGNLDWATSDTLNLNLVADTELTADDLETLGLPS